jgi:magnesium transporter
VIRAWKPGECQLQPVPDSGPLPLASALWLDVESVTPEEEKRLEDALGIEVPTREEQKQLELSSRLYREGDALYLASTMLVNTETDLPEVSTVTCIITRERLLTVRYSEPQAIPVCARRLGRQGGHVSPAVVFQTLMESAVERLGGIMQRLAERIEALSTRIFHGVEGQRRNDALHDALTEVGRIGHVLALVRQSLVEKGLMLSFVDKSGKDLVAADCMDELRLLNGDTRSLTDQATFMGDKITFLLDAAVGYISIEQNRIMTVVSVLAVIFMPPTLVAGIYGMNFKVMPELEWRYGYPYAIALMVALVSVIVWFIRRRRWM